MVQALLLLAALLIFGVCKVSAAPSPYPSSVVVLNVSDPTQPYRTNFCPQLAQATSGNVSNILTLLSGLTINVAFNVPSKETPLYLGFNLTSWQPTSGFMYDTWNTLASTGNFNIRWVLADQQSLSKTSYLTKFAHHYDFYGGLWYSDTVDRRILGLDFLSTLLDVSLYVIVPQQQTQAKFDLLFFANPFSNTLWGMVVAFIAVNAIMFWILQPRKKKVNLGDESIMLGDATYASFANFVNGDRIGEYAHSWEAKLLEVVYLFVIFIIISSYVANLTSFLIIQSTTTTSISSIDDAVIQHATVCVEGGSTVATLLTQYYPTLQQKTFSAPLHVQGVALGLCDCAVANLADWQIAAASADLNPSCNLAKVGDPIRITSGAIVYAQDFSNRCTSFIAGALNILLVQAQSQGLISQSWQKDLSTAAPPPVCSSTSTSAGSSPLDAQNLYGIFLLYGVTLLLVLVVHVTIRLVLHYFPAAKKYYYYDRDETKDDDADVKNEKDRAEEDESNEVVNV